jgi:hypothetical protein
MIHRREHQERGETNYGREKAQKAQKKKTKR